jgi:GNAT superfamily N-acetyltransferase
MTTARARGRAADSLPGITFRLAVDEDLPECGRIHQEGIDGYLVPLGFPPLPRENQSLLRLHAHTRATSPDRFIVAERHKRLGRSRIVAFGSAIDREHLWFLSMLFVEPDEQARGLGRALMDRLLPRERDGRVLSTCTDAAQPISNGLYAALGMVPRNRRSSMRSIGRSSASPTRRITPTTCASGHGCSRIAMPPAGWSATATRARSAGSGPSP